MAAYSTLKPSKNSVPLKMQPVCSTHFHVDYDGDGECSLFCCFETIGKKIKEWMAECELKKASFVVRFRNPKFPSMHHTISTTLFTRDTFNLFTIADMLDGLEVCTVDRINIALQMLDIETCVEFAVYKKPKKQGERPILQRQ